MIETKVNPEKVLKIFKKRNKKVFCKIRLDEEHLEFLDDLQDMLNSPARYVRLTDNILIDKTEIDYIILEN